MTAGHCVDGKNGFGEPNGDNKLTYFVRGGTVENLHGHGLQEDVDRIIIHHGFTRETFENDIAVAKLVKVKKSSPIKYEPRNIL